MVTTVRLPAQFNIESLHLFTCPIVGSNGIPLDDHFIFDFSNIQFIDGCGLTVFCNTLEWLNSHETRREFQNYQRAASAIQYMDKCGFFTKYLGNRLNAEGRLSDTTLPFMSVDHADAHGWLEFSFTPWAAPTLDVSGGRLASVRACVKEVFNNIQDHSTLTTGFVHAQYYPNIDQLHITLSDFGRGIPSTIVQKFGAMDDGQAILCASTLGVTAKNNPNNQGVGLDYLIENVTGNGGQVSIYSFSGVLICSRNAAGQVIREARLGDGVYPGTLVNIMLRKNLFVGDEEEREDILW
jgi:hypothetical protein